MKKAFRILPILILVPALLVAQTSKRTTAHNAFDDFKRDKDAASLKKAKEYIDAAAQHPETGIEAKTWIYRGDIYLGAYANDLSLEGEKQKDVTDPAKKNLVSYSNVPIADLQTAYDSYSKVKQFDKKNNYAEEVAKDLYLVESHFDNKGRADYNSKKSAEAGVSFEKCYEISLVLGKADTSILNYAALAYRIGGEMAKAKAIYQKLIDMDYGKGKTVSILANMFITEKDTASASRIITKGRQKFPSDMDLLTAETNLFLMGHKNKEALANLQKVIEKNPTDPQLNLVVASVFDNMANPKDEAGKDLAVPTEYNDYYKQSESYYKKAIELKPDYFDALYNLGVLYNNQGVKLYNNANNIKDAKKSAEEGKRADEVFKMAIPYLEKAHAINPKDRNTMLSLKQLYAKTEQNEKYEAIKKEMAGGK